MGGYKKLSLLGKGATAEVYLVEDVVSRGRYAMKISENRELLRKEAWILYMLTAPAKEEGAGAVEELAEERVDLKACKYFPEFVAFLPEENALVMEYLEGQDLQSVLSRGLRLELGEVIYIMGEVLRALEALHMHRPAIVYRDLKPANIMLCRDGSVRLIDLGATCFGDAGELMETEAGPVEDGGSMTEGENAREVIVTRAGTYGYAAPEQFWEGAEISKSCDIYSAGKVFAYLLTGKNPAEPPYDVENFCRGICGKQAAFMEVLERSLALSPQARYETAEEMWRAIQRAYEEGKNKAGRPKQQKYVRIYEKCIWKSEYRRIF